jgi:hypothetical protein
MGLLRGTERAPATSRLVRARHQLWSTNTGSANIGYHWQQGTPFALEEPRCGDMGYAKPWSWIKSRKKRIRQPGGNILPN